MMLKYNHSGRVVIRPTEFIEQRMHRFERDEKVMTTSASVPIVCVL
jgi:hypothetical protein